MYDKYFEITTDTQIYITQTLIFKYFLYYLFFLYPPKFV